MGGSVRWSGVGNLGLEREKPRRDLLGKGNEGTQVYVEGTRELRTKISFDVDKICRRWNCTDSVRGR